MSMTVQGVINEVRAMVLETSPANSHFTDANVLTYVNECTLQLMAYLGSFPKVNYTLTSATTMTMGENLLCLDYAAIQNPDASYKKLKSTDFDSFVLQNPDWLNAPQGIPTFIIRMDVLNWMLWPVPLAIYTGVPVEIYGKTLPAQLTVATQELPLSILFNNCYLFYVAWKVYLNHLNQPDKAKDAFETFDNFRKINTQAATATQGTLKSFNLTKM